jgi:hypothetical protein
MKNQDNDDAYAELFSFDEMEKIRLEQEQYANKRKDNHYEVVVGAGKYTFFVDTEYRVGCLRFGGQWIEEFQIGSKALLTLIQEMSDLRKIKEPVSWLWTILVDNPKSGRQTIAFPSLHDTEEGVRSEVERKFESVFIKAIKKDPLCYFHMDEDKRDD